MIHNIIFDLGGVILNIDYQRTEDAFKALGMTNFDELYSKQLQVSLFDRFEKGEISASEFRDGIRMISNLQLSDEHIDEAWNKMLIELPEKNLLFLEKLKKNYRLFLLSNTNEIHIDGFTKIIFKQYGSMPFDEIFEKIYYSNLVGLRKPDKEIFQLVLDENNLIAGETLFIDDTARHLAGAEAAVIHTLHLKQGDEITGLLEHFL